MYSILNTIDSGDHFLEENDLQLQNFEPRRKTNSSWTASNQDKYCNRMKNFRKILDKKWFISIGLNQIKPTIGDIHSINYRGITFGYYAKSDGSYQNLNVSKWNLIFHVFHQISQFLRFFFWILYFYSEILNFQLLKWLLASFGYPEYPDTDHLDSNYTTI